MPLPAGTAGALLIKKKALQETLQRRVGKFGRRHPGLSRIGQEYGGKVRTFFVAARDVSNR